MSKSAKKPSTPHHMTVAGVMSGTSGDGIEVAIVHLDGQELRTRIKLLHHQHFDFSPTVRYKVMSMMDSVAAGVADLARLNFFLGELYATAVRDARREAKIPQLDLIGCHGQTLYHQGVPAAYLDRKTAATWQIGEGAVLAARTGVPVVSDFRPADIAAGGKGAPLVSLLDYLFFRKREYGVILQNLGGIGNLTAIPVMAELEDVVAFDTGPGNMVIDAVTELYFQQPFDRDGNIAAEGKVSEEIVKKLLAHQFFQQPAPRTAGREQFGSDFILYYLQLCRNAPGSPMKNEDIVATATAFTAATIGYALRNQVSKASYARPESSKYREFIVSGGGARNATLMRLIGEQVEPLELTLRRSDDLGMPAEAKEAIAFALLAYRTWHRLPGNIPSATGARRPAILGKISFP